jgi:hypothetical protein
MVATIKGDAPIRVGIDHPNYKAEVMVRDATRESLAEDLK